MEPLAYRMSPRTLEEFFGQKHILGEDKLLSRAIKADRLSSIILWGPPGCGKTALARVIANMTKNKFKKLNAVNSGTAEIKEMVAEAKNLLMNPSGRIVLFVDEIHRFNKSQQDTLLPYVEDGTVILIGATTENPYFEVNKALLSRSTVFKLEPLQAEDVVLALKNALSDKERGLGNYLLEINDKTLFVIADMVNGDVRKALNILEMAVLTTDMASDGLIHIDEKVVRECSQQRVTEFDKNGDSHYDNISAFIKSMRGSSPDGALFYLARAIAGGEDPMFLARRIVICAAEDVGMADPNALVVASAGAQAVHLVGMPEARIILAEMAVYVAKAPKSNASYMGINMALDDVMNTDTGTIPMHIRNAPVEEMKQFGYHEGYKYAHDYEGGFVEQQYLPDKIKDKKYYIEK
ncbi:MAG: replication-associated recombination protein A [Clostridia bacterium]|nr:replication-associated recombination protein A [Clostridia bacterium]